MIDSGLFATDNLTSYPITHLDIMGTIFFASTYYGAGVYRTTNRGQSWSPANKGLTNNSVIAFLQIGDNLFAGTDGGGGFRSTDSGLSWQAINEGLPEPNISVLGICGEYIYTGSRYNKGVWRRPLSDFNLSSVASAPIQTNSLSLNSYPDPITSTATISFTIPETSFTSLKLYDATGSEVAMLANGYFDAGEHDVPFDRGNLADGIYFYRLEANGQSQTRAMVVMR